MKKVFVAVAFVATLGLALVSCNKNENRCWKVTYNDGNGKACEIYQWSSETLMEKQKSDWEGRVGYTNVKYKKAKDYKTEKDCNAANPNQNQ